jgi:hypothetical protein
MEEAVLAMPGDRGHDEGLRQQKEAEADMIWPFNRKTIQWRVDITWSTERGLDGTGITFPYSMSKRAPSFQAAMETIMKARRTPKGPVAFDDYNDCQIIGEFYRGSIEELTIQNGRVIKQETVWDGEERQT